MAEAVLSPLLEVIIEKLVSLITNEVQLMKGVSEEIEKLSKTLSRIQACITDAEEREVTEEAIRLWLKELKDVAYDADDIIDEFATGLLQSNAKKDGNSTPEYQVCCFSSPCLRLKQVTTRRKIGNKIKKIREKIDGIIKEGSQFKLREGVLERRTGMGQTLPTDSFVTDSEIYGRDKDKTAVVDMLLNSGYGLDTEDLSVVSIVGLGGLGKTTLARLAYNDERVVKHFKIKIWVCVSDDFDVKRLIKAILESIEENQPNLFEMESLKSRLWQKLNQKRYLLVLDDVWNEDVEKWNSLESLLRCGGKGSKIMVTTRSQKVALIVGTANPYHLGVLSDVDCWSLFKQRAFGRETENAYPNLVQIGKQIVTKCKGVPLAAKALGSLMFFKREENDWLFVRDCEIWNLPEDQNGILPALRLSYNHLPAHLKQCFAYCSIFPKDDEIDKEELIRQWIAEGFIQTSKGCRIAEDVGNEYFNELLWRSFFQSVEKEKWGNRWVCTMHDLVHDLAQSITRETCLILNCDRDEGISKETRHLSLNIVGKARLPMSLYEARNLHTLLFVYLYNSPEVPSVALQNMFWRLRCLRVLTLGGDILKLPASIGNLIHLRYLDVSGTSIKKLPKSVSNLVNLQTLKLGDRFKKLPQDLRHLKNLRHLDIRNCKSLTCMPPKIGELCFLQTLPRFILSKESQCGIGELQGLDLRGDLKIENLENVDDVADAKKANLKDKRNLQKLGLCWSRNTSTKNIEEVLEGLQPHPNLKTLMVESYSGVYFPKWLMDLKLPNLIHILLFNCPNCDLLPLFGSLPSLEFLILKEMHAVKYISVTVEGFPSLKRLHLQDLPNLEELPHTNGQELLPCLEELIIDRCPKFTSIPMHSSIKRLELYESSAEILSSVGSLTSLSHLGIDSFKELKFLPEGMLQHLDLLQSLQISKCPELRSLPRELGNLASLENLGIHFCSKLECLPGEFYCLSSLKYLGIVGCDNLISFPDGDMQGLTALTKVSILECQNLTCLPSAFRHLTMLKDLEILYLPALTALPEDLQHLTNLESLRFGGFDDSRFTSLPEWLGNLTSLEYLEIVDLSNVKSLPMGMRHLSSLRRLLIANCPHLDRRCKKDTGEEWHKVEHIPHVNIYNGARIRYGHRRLMNAMFVSAWAFQDL